MRGNHWAAGLRMQLCPFLDFYAVAAYTFLGESDARRGRNSLALPLTGGYIS